MPTTIYFIRHGEVHNPRGIYYGRLPRFRLSQRGREQAAQAAAFLMHKPLDVIYTSPMLRARQTAALLRAGRPVPLRVSRLLNEVRSPYDGQLWKVLEDRHYDVYTGSPVEYEQAADVLARMLAFIRRARRQWDGGAVAAVSHGSPLAVLLDWARGVDEPRSTHRIPGNAAVCTLVFHSADPDERPALSIYDPNA